VDYLDRIISRFVVEGAADLGRAAGAHLRGAGDFVKSGRALDALLANVPRIQGWGNALSRTADNWMQMAGTLEQSQVAFTTLLGSGDAATSMLADLRQFAATTPFEFMGLQEQAKQLLAYGFTGEQVIPMLRNVGDAAAAMGGRPETIDRLIRALGQMQAKGKVSGEEIRQIAEGGIPVYQILQDELGLTKEQLADIGSSGIDANRGIEAILRGMGERYPNMMEAQSKTYLGAVSNMKDAQDEFATAMGETMIGPMTDVTKMISKVTAEIAGLPEPMREAIGWGTLVGGKALQYGGSVLSMVGDFKQMGYMKSIAEATAASAAGRGISGAVAPAVGAAAGGATTGVVGAVGGTAGGVAGGAAIGGAGAAVGLGVGLGAIAAGVMVAGGKAYQAIGRATHDWAYYLNPLYWPVAGGYQLSVEGKRKRGEKAEDEAVSMAERLRARSIARQRGYAGRATQQPNGTIQVQQTLTLEGAGPSQQNFSDYARLGGG